MAKLVEEKAVAQAMDILVQSKPDWSNLMAKDGLLKTMTKALVEKALESEMSAHLGYDKYDRENTTPNARNGVSRKKIYTEHGDLDIEVPRDRESSFEPQLVPKRKIVMAGLDDKILSLYAKGMTVSDIQKQVHELYDAEVSTSFISKVSDGVLEEVRAWQNRSLEHVYAVVYFDCIFVKVRHDKRIINKAVYVALGISMSGHKDVLGLWISENEGAKFWLSNLTELKNRGLHDILIACTDNLKGMTEAIAAMYPKTAHQLCIVHQIRNSLRYVSYKDRKELVADLKPIYTAATEDEAQDALSEFEQKWDKQYPHIIKSWCANWENLIIFLEYPPEIRRIIYTTNAIESLNSQLRKVSKNKRIFPSDDSVFKTFYLAIEAIMKKWTMPVRNWTESVTHFMVKFDDRLEGML